MGLAPVPWARRVWALPCLTVLAPSARYDEHRGRRHQTVLDRAAQAITRVKRLLPERGLRGVVDSSYRALAWLDRVRPWAPVITRLRLDATL